MSFDKLSYNKGDALSLPKGWEIKKLGEVSEILNGGTPKTNIAEYWGGDIHWITPADLGKLKKPTVDDTPRKITRLGLEKSSAKLFPENSIILSTRAPIGHLAINEVPMSTNQGCRGVVPNKKLDTWYLYYFLKKNVELLDSLGTGATFKELSTKALAGVEIPLPPLPEQQRIVSILDEAFAAIAKAKANAEQNLKNAKELFESYLQGVFEKKGDGWEEKKLREAFEIKPPKKEAKEKLSDNELVSFLPMEDLGVCENEIKPVKERPLKDVAGSYTYFAENDVLLAKITPCFENGKLGVAKNLTNGIGFGSSEYIVFRSNGEIEPEFLFYFLSRNSFREEGKKFMSGAVGHKRVSKDWIENYLFPFPKSKEAQQTIVRQLDALRAETQKLEAVYQKKIDDLEELKKSILQKAFAGELRSPEGAAYDSEAATPLADDNDGYSPSDKKKKSITSPEGVK